MVKIRWAKSEDTSEILSFINDLAVYEKLEADVIASVETLRSHLFAAKAFAEVIFIEDRKEKLGFALFFHNFSTFLAKPGIYIEDLFVKPHARGRGFGKQLLAFLAKLANERGCGRLEWSVLNWNEPAIQFYRSLGAKPMEEWTVFRLTEKGLSDLAKESTL